MDPFMDQLDQGGKVEVEYFLVEKLDQKMAFERTTGRLDAPSICKCNVNEV